MPQPKVSIIILNWNNVSDTLSLLANLEEVNYPNFSVLVIDNASTDDSVGQLARYMERQRRAEKPTLKVSLLPLSKNYGFAEGNNKGVLHASREKPDYYLLLNNDTVVSPDFLTKLVQAAEADEKLAVVGPTIYFADTNGHKQDRIWFAGSHVNWYTGGAHHDIEKPAKFDDNTIVPVPFITGCCFLIKRSILAKIDQLFDPAFFAYSEDVDLCFRLTEAGYTLGYVPGAEIWHKLATSSGGPKSYNFWYYNIRNNFLILARYARWQHWFGFLPYFLFYNPVLPSIVGMIVRPRPDKPRRLVAITHGIFDAIRGHYGPLNQGKK